MLRCPAASPFLCREWVSYAFREVAEKRRWSWLSSRGQFLMPQVVTAGLVDVTRQSDTVTGVGTAWDGSEITRQFRIGTQTPIYTIASVDVGAQTLTLDEVWGGDTQSGAGYQIYRAYVTVPDDFHSFISVYDPRYNWQLWLHIQQEELNAWDAQRAQSGTAWVVADYAYDSVSSPPLPRYEIWPHQKAQYVYPFLYENRATDLEDFGATLPRYIRGDVLLELATAQAARWPGPSKEQPNPYFNLALARDCETRAQFMLAELERQDDEVVQSSLWYGERQGLPFATLPFGDSRWLQAHDI